jgi:stearoyl-CoA desaturase (delta-9 desaturase)
MVSGHEIRWPITIYLGLCHLVGVYALFSIPHAKPLTLLFAFVCYVLGGFGITGGAHRLWAHRSYKAAIPFRTFLMICNAMANQGTIFHWCRDHRVHHKYSETDADPHNAHRGFFFAHIGWLLVKRHPKVVDAVKQVKVDDLLEDPVVAFQYKFNPIFNLSVCFLIPAIIPMAWGETLTIAFLMGMLRYLWTLHMTWLVNSAAHFWGEKPYDPNSNPSENPYVALGTLGEGWHTGTTHFHTTMLPPNLATSSNSTRPSFLLTPWLPLVRYLTASVRWMCGRRRR